MFGVWLPVSMYGVLVAVYGGPVSVFMSVCVCLSVLSCAWTLTLSIFRICYLHVAKDQRT